MKQIFIFLTTCIVTISYAQTFDNMNAGLPEVFFSITALGDVDGDSDLDLYLSGSNVGFTTVGGLYIYDAANQTYTLSTTSGLPLLTSGSARWGDIDNDNDLDLLIQGYNSSFSGESDIYINNNDGTFTAMNLGFPSIYLGEVALVDINNDNFLDVAFTGIESTNFTYLTKIYKNNGGTSFTELTGSTIPGFEYGRIKFADYNSDTYQDFVLSGWNDINELSYTKIFTNNGNETFTESTIPLLSTWNGDTEWGDYNNDGNIDLVISGLNNDSTVRSTELYKNNGDGTFTVINASFEGISHGSLEWGDFDTDGDLDLLVIGSSPDATEIYTRNIYNNTGNDVFTLSTTAVFTGSYNGDVDSGDINNDGKIDLVITGYDETNLPNANIYLNTSTLGLDNFHISSLNIYPNPSIDKKFIIQNNSNTPLNELSILDINGRVVLKENLNNLLDSKTINTSNLISGIYFVKIRSQNKIAVKKIILN